MSRRLHILHVFPTFTAGGAQMRFATLANHLAGSLRHSIVSIQGAPDARQLLAKDVEYELLPAPATGATAAIGYARLLRRLRPDLLQTYNWGAMDAVIGGILARVCSVLHTEDGFGPDEAVRLKRRRVMARRVLLRFAYSTVVPSKTLFAIAHRSYRLPETKVRLISNGVDMTRFCPGSEPELRWRWGVADGEFLVGTIGRLRGEKNFELLLRAFAAARLPNARLVLVGDGEKEAQLRKTAGELGLGSAVVFAGAFVDTSPCYRAFDLFAMSSATEQMPLSLLEAMASGLPAVCTNVGDTAAILETSQPPAVVAKDDIAGYAAALRNWSADGALRREAGCRNRERCAARYSIENMVRSWSNLYAEAAVGGRRPVSR